MSEEKDSFDSKQLKEAFKKMTGGEEIEYIGADEYFDFECQRCGRCCMGREDIIINPFDVFNGARYLKISTQEFIEKYTTTHIGDTSKLPVICLKCNEENHNWCPLLELDVLAGAKFKCKIDKAKPGACRNHPIGRVTAYSRSDDGTMSKLELKEKYVKVSQCEQSQGHHVMNKVSDWVANTLETPEDREASQELQLGVWHDFDLPRFTRVVTMFVRLEDVFKANKDNITNDIRSVIPEGEASKEQLDASMARAEDIFNMAKTVAVGMYNLIYSTTYIDYDINKPFAEQARKRAEDLREGIKHFKDFQEILEDMISNHANPEIAKKVSDYIEKGVEP